jgi:hypothetical protein
MTAQSVTRILYKTTISPRAVLERLRGERRPAKAK